MTWKKEGRDRDRDQRKYTEVLYGIVIGMREESNWRNGESQHARKKTNNGNMGGKTLECQEGEQKELFYKRLG